MRLQRRIVGLLATMVAAAMSLLTAPAAAAAKPAPPPSHAVLTVADADAAYEDDVCAAMAPYLTGDPTEFCALSASTVEDLPDGGWLVGGAVVGVWNDNDQSWALVIRIAPDGSFDTAFGADGLALHAGDAALHYADLALDGAGRIIAVGAALPIDPPPFPLADRWSADGTDVTSFDVGWTGTLNDVVVLPGGAILAAGERDLVIPSDDGPSEIRTVPALVRFRDGGALDARFGDGGIATVPIRPDAAGWFSALAVDSQGQPVAGATTSYTPLVVRFTKAGRLDRSFGMGGVVTDQDWPAPYAAVRGIGFEDKGVITVDIDRVYRLDRRGRLAAPHGHA